MPGAQPVFRLDGEFWTVGYEDLVCHFRDTRGFQLLAYLLARPGKRIAALELISACESPPQAGCQMASGRIDLDAAERARVNATRAIKTALQRIAAHHHSLA